MSESGAAAAPPMDLDHVAIATSEVSELLNTLVGRLGTPIIESTGTGAGFKQAVELDRDQPRSESVEEATVASMALS